MSSPKSILYLLLALALVRGVIYASFVPPWQAPDEPGQFERVRASLSVAEWNSTSENPPAWYNDLAQALFTFNYGDFLPTQRPIYSSEAPLSQYMVLYQEAYDGLYSSQIPYALIGWPLFLTNQQDIALQFYLVRLNTVLMNVGIIFLAFLLTQTIFPKDKFLGLGVPILVLFIPQHTHLLSTVNNGNLAELFTLTALYFVVKGIIKGFTPLAIVAILFFSILAMQTKATAYFLPVVIATVGLFYLWRYRLHWRWLIPIGLGLLGLAYFVVPDRLYVIIASAWISFKAGNIYLDPIVPIIQFRSFWALPGWLILNLHPLWYQLLMGMCILAATGLVILVVTRRKMLFLKQYQAKTQALIVLAVAIVVTLSIIIGWSALTNTIAYRQGRSLYPVLVPIVIFLMLGWRQLIPVHWRNFGLLTITSFFFMFDTMVLFHYIIPFFYSRY